MIERPTHTPLAVRRALARRAYSILIGVALLAACATPTPEIVVQTQVQVQTQVVEQTVEVPVEETVEVEVPVNVVVTATPEPLGDFTLRAAHYGKWETFNPLTIYGGNMVDTAQRVFSPLVAQDVNGKVFGDLAESWEVSADGTTYTFILRQGVKWHDGEPFTAEDVVFTFEMAANPATGSVYSGQLAPIVGAEEFTAGTADSIEGVQAVDDYTVELTVAEPNSHFLVTLTNIFMLPSHLLADMDPAEFPSSEFALEAPVGTGPYKLVAFDSVNQVVSYDAHVDYHWGTPRIPHVQWVWISQPDAEIVAFERQEIDYAPWHIWNEAHYRQAKAVITLQNIPIAWGNVGGIVINSAQPYFADARVRQAMAMAINRSQFLVDSGYNRLYRGFFDLAAWARNPQVDLNTRYPFDPAAARALLEEANWDFDRQVTLYTTVTGADPTRLAIQQMLGEIGMQIELTQVETAVVDKALNQDRPPTYDLYITGFPLNDPGLGVAVALKCDSPGNFFGYCNPELDALIEQDRLATTAEERTPILQQIEAILAEEVPLIPLTYSPQYVGFSTSCTIARYAWYTFSYMHEWACEP